MQREGVFREMKLRGHYEKPSEKKARERAEAIRRARKLARKKLQREGLLPMKPKVIPGAMGRSGPPCGCRITAMRHLISVHTSTQVGNLQICHCVLHLLLQHLE